MMASWRTSACRIASGCCSQSHVLPSTSVNRKVTVPLGSSAILGLLETSEPSGMSQLWLPSSRGRQVRTPAKVEGSALDCRGDREVRPCCADRARDEPVDVL